MVPSRVAAVGLALLGVTVVVLGLLWGLQRRLVFFPGPGPVPPAADVLPGARDVVLETDDGLALGAWWSRQPAPTVGSRCSSPTATPGTARCGRRWPAPSPMRG
jgi:hypothetical protein